MDRLLCHANCMPLTVAAELEKLNCKVAMRSADAVSDADDMLHSQEKRCEGCLPLPLPLQTQVLLQRQGAQQALRVGPEVLC